MRGGAGNENEKCFEVSGKKIQYCQLMFVSRTKFLISILVLTLAHFFANGILQFVWVGIFVFDRQWEWERDYRTIDVPFYIFIFLCGVKYKIFWRWKTFRLSFCDVAWISNALLVRPYFFPRYFIWRNEFNPFLRSCKWVQIFFRLNVSISAMCVSFELSLYSISCLSKSLVNVKTDTIMLENVFSCTFNSISALSLLMSVSQSHIPDKYNAHLH